jgi:hypothetical protein
MTKITVERVQEADYGRLPPRGPACGGDLVGEQPTELKPR